MNGEGRNNDSNVCDAPHFTLFRNYLEDNGGKSKEREKERAEKLERLRKQVGKQDRVKREKTNRRKNKWEATVNPQYCVTTICSYTASNYASPNVAMFRVLSDVTLSRRSWLLTAMLHFVNGNRTSRRCRNREISEAINHDLLLPWSRSKDKWSIYCNNNLWTIYIVSK